MLGTTLLHYRRDAAVVLLPNVLRLHVICSIVGYTLKARYDLNYGVESAVKLQALQDTITQSPICTCFFCYVVYTTNHRKSATKPNFV